MSSRQELERRVDELAAAHKGQAFADAVKSLVAELGAEDEKLLKDILVRRAANLDQAVMDRVDARGWIRRQWDRAAFPPPRDR
ncbi:MAG TPA: hypothetical protein VM184_03935 [Gaiellaceae bacterium]|nr:hypothetical protein [Gaiellaceae bacterium]